MFFNRKCKITFIKHGATINTEEHRFFDDGNFPAINENGKYEMEKISEWVVNKGLKIDKIYTGPALRCTQSTRILSDFCNQDFEILDELKNRRMGQWSGLSLEQIEQQYPGKLDLFYRNPDKYTPEGSEDLLSFNKRINNTINDIIAHSNQKRLIIVTHGEIIQAAIANAIGIPPENQYKIYIPSGSATQISYFTNWSSLIYSAYIPL